MSVYYDKKTGQEIKLQPADILLYRADSLVGRGIQLFSWSQYTHVGIAYPCKDKAISDVFSRNWVIDANPPTVQIRTLSYDLLHDERSIAVFRVNELETYSEEFIWYELAKYCTGKIDIQDYGYSTIGRHAWQTVKNIFGSDWPMYRPGGDANPPICSEFVGEFFALNFEILMRTDRPTWAYQPKHFAETDKTKMIAYELGVKK